MALPDITHLQFLIVDLLRFDEHSGRYIRERLAEEGEERSGPSFYQLMSRLEESGYVTGWYESHSIDGQTIKERKYRITPKGHRIHKTVHEFYQSRAKTIGSKDGKMNDTTSFSN